MVTTQRILRVEGLPENSAGWVCIDSTIAGRATGGVRMLPDLSEEELAILARTMTLKYGYWGLPFGGAKAGIQADPEMPLEEKRKLLLAFGEALSPLIQLRSFSPGPDMGINTTELCWLLEGAGLPSPRNLFLRKAQGVFTALSVCAAIQACLHYLGRPLKGATIAIEGFGCVGVEVARLAADMGMRVVAVSTREGAVFNEKGLNVVELVQAKERQGSGFVHTYREADCLPREALLELPVDVLSPCAQYHSIKALNAPAISARAVVAGANNPVTEEAGAFLNSKGVLVLPDFLTNGGGVLGATMTSAGLQVFSIHEIIWQAVTLRCRKLLASHGQTNSLRSSAEAIAWQRFIRMKRTMEQCAPWLNSGLDAIVSFHRRGYIPPFLVRPFAWRFFKRRLYDTSN